eukprot:gnl/TRDRNA2_/TRDRNA2_59686_c0_seq1.p1 gnl/TRDRNA2_/TRDRNA2_59686_c0~~gnl/TRDRNA2_/TRDRNA2_59686_c0_seq1.p1  ORF type:complete len:467 (+),score=93.46 gnl/TRDRNA2_/TRDRNA2_59686_c0_seq1:59-1402(+)
MPQAIQQHERRKSHWAAHVNTNFTQEFSDKKVPLERSAAEQSQHELEELEDYFGMGRGAENSKEVVKAAFSFAALTLYSCREPKQRRRSSGGNAESSEVCLQRKYFMHWRASLVMAQAEDAAKIVMLPRYSKGPEEGSPDSKGSPSGTRASQFGGRGMMITQLSPTSSRDASPERNAVPPVASKQAVPPLDLGKTTVSTQRGRSRDSSPGSQVQEGRRTRSRDHSPIDQMLSDHTAKAHGRLTLLHHKVIDYEAVKRIHKPVSAQELMDASPPVPISAVDFPPITPRRMSKEAESVTHYEYFQRRCPMVHPLHRYVMMQRSMAVRRVLKYGSPPDNGTAAARMAAASGSSSYTATPGQSNERENSADSFTARPPRGTARFTQNDQAKGSPKRPPVHLEPVTPRNGAASGACSSPAAGASPLPAIASSAEKPKAAHFSTEADQVVVLP